MKRSVLKPHNDVTVIAIEGLFQKLLESALKRLFPQPTGDRHWKDESNLQ